MATEEVTTSLNVDITQFKTAMTAANRYIRTAYSEFENASAGVDGFADSTEGAQAQIAKLNKILEAQKVQAAALQHEYEKVAAEQGENSAGAQELAIKLNKAQAAVKKTKAEMGKYEKKLDEAENSTEQTEKATGEMSAAFGKAATAAGTLAKGLAKIAGKTVVAGIKGIAAASASLVTAFIATGEASKEHITEMAKLGAAYKSAGHSAEAAAATYSELYSVIGETDQAVEAAQQIALLAKSEEDAAKWAAMGAGVIGKFGDALQPETFFEAANETFSLNEATGAYVQMIEQSGLSVDEFNKGLAACTTQEQKQAYMLEYTQQALAGAGEAYREANAAVIENNKANTELQAQLSEVGKAALPVTSTLKLMGAALLQDLMPNIKTFGAAFKEALGGSSEAAHDMGNAVGSMITTLLQKFVAALPSIVTMGVAIVKNLVQGLIQSAPAIGASVVQLAQYLYQAAGKLLQTGATMGAELLGKLGEGIKTGMPGLVSQGLDILMNFATKLYDAVPQVLEVGISLIKNIVQGILDSLPTLLEKGPEVVSKFANIINDNAPRILKAGFELIVQIVKGIISAIPTLIANIPKIITAIVNVWEAFGWATLGSKAITGMKNGIEAMKGAIKTAAENVQNAITSTIQALPGKLLAFGKNGITSLGNALQVGVVTVKSHAVSIVNGMVSAFQSLPGKMVEIGKSVIQGVIDGIQSMIGALYDSIKNALSGLVDKAKAALGINSPSKVFANIVGRAIPEGIAYGINKNMDLATKSVAKTAKAAVAAANDELAGATIGGPKVGGSGAPGTGGRGGAVYNFYQYNTSPKPLSRKDVYRQTKNALKFATSNA